MIKFLLGLIAGGIVSAIFCRIRIKNLEYYYELERYFSRQRETYN